MTAYNVPISRRELDDQGWTIVSEDPSERVQVTKNVTGQYVSYYDPELRAILIVKHSKLREALGI